VSGADIEHASAWFNRHGRSAILIGRLVPGIRSLISVPAGINRMPLAPFLLYTTVGSGVWTGLLAYLGYILGARYQEVERYVNPVSYVVLAVVAVGYVYRVVRHRGGTAGNGERGTGNGNFGRERGGGE